MPIKPLGWILVLNLFLAFNTQADEVPLDRNKQEARLTDLVEMFRGVEGSVSGGGGTVISSPTRDPRLADFVIGQKDFDEERAFSKVQKEFLSSTREKPVSVIQLESSKAVDVLGYKYVDNEIFQNSMAYHFLSWKLDQWQPHAEALVFLLKDELKNVRMTLTNRSLSAKSCFQESPAHLDTTSKLHAAAVFHPYFGMITNYPIWSELGTLSQAGLILHETFRRLQQVHNQEIDNPTVMAFTNSLLLERPEPQTDLDQLNVFGDYHQLLAKVSSPALVKKQMCKELSEITYLKTANNFCHGIEDDFDPDSVAMRNQHGKIISRKLEVPSGVKLKQSPMDIRHEQVMDMVDQIMDRVRADQADIFAPEQAQQAHDFFKRWALYKIDRKIGRIRTLPFVSAMGEFVRSILSGFEQTVRDYHNGTLELESSYSDDDSGDFMANFQDNGASETVEAIKDATCMISTNFNQMTQYGYCTSKPLSQKDWAQANAAFDASTYVVCGVNPNKYK